MAQDSPCQARRSHRQRGRRIGTTLHIVDPKNPGAVDEIVHLGDYWDESGMRANREEILTTNREIKRLFARAYDNLRASKAFHDELESYYSLALNLQWLNSKTEEMLVEVFGSKRLNKLGNERHLFASAITPDGPKNHLETLISSVSRRYIWVGAPGTGKSTMVKKLADAALQKGYDVEYFHCPLDPSRVDHAIIAELNLALITSVDPHTYSPRLGDATIDTDSYLDDSILLAHQEDIIAARGLYEEALARAVTFLRRAKDAHDALEACYIPNINFDGVETRRQQVLARILELAEERRPAGIGN